MDQIVQTRQAALERVLAFRERGRRRPAPVRIALASLGALLLIAAVPLIPVLPEGGVPALLLALRLLAVEVDWAAKAYAWIDWRFAQVRVWFRRQDRRTRTAITTLLLAVGIVLLWLLVEAFL